MDIQIDVGNKSQPVEQGVTGIGSAISQVQLGSEASDDRVAPPNSVGQLTDGKPDVGSGGDVDVKMASSNLKVITSVSLPPNLLTNLKRIAASEGRSVSSLVSSLLTNAIKGK